MLCPLKWGGVGVVGLSEAVNCQPQILRGGEAGVLQRYPTKQAEPYLDLVEPGSVSGGEVEVDVGMMGKPLILRGFVRTTV